MVYSLKEEGVWPDMFWFVIWNSNWPDNKDKNQIFIEETLATG